MHRFIEIVKAHPMAILGGVLIGVVIIFLATRGGGKTVSPTYAGDENNNAAINAALVAEQDQARVAENIAALQFGSQDHATDAALAAYKVAADSHASDNQTAITMQSNNNSATLAYQAAANTVTLDANQKQFALATDSNAKTFAVTNDVNAKTFSLAQQAEKDKQTLDLTKVKASLISQEFATAQNANNNYTMGLISAYAANSYDGANNAGQMIQHQAVTALNNLLPTIH